MYLGENRFSRRMPDHFDEVPALLEKLTPCIMGGKIKFRTHTLLLTVSMPMITPLAAKFTYTQMTRVTKKAHDQSALIDH